MTPRAEYPRPDFKRKNFITLNGEWDFAYDDNDIGISSEWFSPQCDSFDQTITVPFTYLCLMSGINCQDFHDIVWYRKVAKVARKDGKRVILHFGAIDYISNVWVNGQLVSIHEGGNTPIEVDITDALIDGDDQTIVVRAFDDSFDFETPRGKQFWKRTSEGIFYTRTVGIWQTVWMEEVSDLYLTHSKVTANLDDRDVCFELELSQKNAIVEVEINLDGQKITADTMVAYNGKVKSKIWLDSSISLDWNHQESWTWSPENPVLFDVTYTVKDLDSKKICDKVEGYFAFRKVDIVDGEIMLNNRPYYIKFLLDQGYFRKSLLTAPDDQAFVDDILNAKKMGFNGVRKHQKVEDPRYLYWADKLGFLVWGESPSSYEYSDKAVRRHQREWIEIIRRDYNHPCIIAWVPINESWGVHEILERKDEQAHSLALYYQIKSLDQTRFVISNDGWTHTKSDIITIHDYTSDSEKLADTYKDLPSIINSFPGNRPLFAKGYEYDGAPFIVSEFGGISYKVDDTDGWGYTTAEHEEDFLKAYEGVITPLLRSKYVKGFVYTQLTDVEQEINGLMTYDRVFKVAPEKILQINNGMKN